MASLTAHCLVKNEEKFIRAAILSVIEYVDTLIVYDTGSTDATSTIVRELQKQFTSKIIFEEKGECDKERHTQLRQEMVERTKTQWFMVLDGDEVWTSRGMQALVSALDAATTVQCVIAPFYLCVGDVYHYSWRGQFEMNGVRMHATARAFRCAPGVHWSGSYERDDVYDANGVSLSERSRALLLGERFWHMTHLVRSAFDEFSSGGSRFAKLVPTYLFVGKRIPEPIPEVLASFKPQSFVSAFVGLLRYLFSRLRLRFTVFFK